MLSIWICVNFFNARYFPSVGDIFCVKSGWFVDNHLPVFIAVLTVCFLKGLYSSQSLKIVFGLCTR